MCKNWVCTMHACEHEHYEVLRRAKGGVCVFETSPFEEYYCARVAFEPVFYLSHDGPCPDCANNHNNDSRPRPTNSKPEAPEPSLRRWAILNSCYTRLDEEHVRWDPTGIVEDTMLYRLMHIDTTLDGAALWARLIVTLPEREFWLSDKMHLLAIWHGKVKGKYPDETLESIIHTLTGERGPEDEELMRIRAAFDAARKRSAE
ncbi:hypothetical protein PG985_002295 [Apiospora marii]|uniref:uncharacterized protein n=1 Tax=Apiospora marii TaxID=335849 RepID=UPI00312FD9F3